MSLVIGPIGSYDSTRVIQATVGATTIRPGDIVKFSSGLIIPAVATDAQGVFFVAIASGAIGGLIPIVPLQDCVLRILYSGSAPTMGSSYGILDTRTLAQTNTTQKLLTVVKVGTTGGLDSGYVSAIGYQLSS
jgi:hypothetical protein